MSEVDGGDEGGGGKPSSRKKQRSREKGEEEMWKGKKEEKESERAQRLDECAEGRWLLREKKKVSWVDATYHQEHNDDVLVASKSPTS
ncbi:hypothetical protein PoB_004975500 [Plakobranchus ocellatus]|uniref:Uncharacterized protein n=1 Tax=Plakobranchus ocellatus TaxID=259542 RepID=A0AAV4BVV5_9GAST|nr:hypothetical protein PoB_004975500 [Plakobranchus ocellatus]